jgi:hypothetical protein
VKTKKPLQKGRQRRQADTNRAGKTNDKKKKHNNIKDGIEKRSV